MVGNGTLVVILGFAMAFAFAGRYWNKEATQGVETASAYYGQANVRIRASRDAGSIE